jgi:hypothetical protein
MLRFDQHVLFYLKKKERLFIPEKIQQTFYDNYRMYLISYFVLTFFTFNQTCFYVNGDVQNALNKRQGKNI